MVPGSFIMIFWVVSLFPCSEIFKHIGHADKKPPKADCKKDRGLGVELAGKDYRKGGSQNGS